MMPPTNELLDAYTDMVLRNIGWGYDPYLMTFMFNQLPGSPTTKARQMEREVERIYTMLLTRIHRKPRNIPIVAMPMLMASPDWPVPKSEAKDPLSYATVNDGLHLHGIWLQPPSSRMREKLDDHIDECQAHYSGPDKALFRLHVEPITFTPEHAVRYVFKSLKRRRVGADAVIILPCAHSEMPRLSRSERLERHAGQTTR